MFVMPFQTFLIGMPALFTGERGSFLFFDTDFTDDTVYGIIDASVISICEGRFPHLEV